MKVQRKSAVIVSGLAVVLAAAIGGGIAIGGGTESTVAITTTTSSSAPVSSTAVAVPSDAVVAAPAPVAHPATEVKAAVRPAKAGSAVLDHFGRGPARLGMSLAEVEAAGLLGDINGAPGPCTSYSIAGSDGGRIEITEPRGVEVIWAEDGVSTSEGIRIGSTVEELRAAYPVLEEGVNGFYVRLADNPGAHYYFLPTQAGTISAISVNQQNQSCYN